MCKCLIPPLGGNMSQSTTRVQIINAAETDLGGGFKLCLQWCRYLYGDGSLEYGYRSIWKDPKGKLLAHRGQARVPSLRTLLGLINTAVNEGWGDYDGASLSLSNFLKITSVERGTGLEPATLSLEG